MLLKLGRDLPESFVHAAEKLGMPVTSQTMDAFTAEAMWEAANVNTNGQRLIRRYLYAFFGKQFFVPESKIESITEDVFAPEFGEFVLEKKTISFWFKRIDDILSHCLKKVHEEDENFTYKSADIIVGVDHGQRKFRALLKIILRNADGETVLQRVIKIGHIDCEKDTAEIFQNTIGGPINESLKRVAGKGLLVGKKRQDDSVYVKFGKYKESAEDTLVIHVATRTFITGDLSFYSTMLGKDHVSGSWCWLYTLEKTAQGVEGHECGTPWTLELMENTREDIDSKKVKDTSQNRKGCCTKPIFDVIPVIYYVAPVLHLMLGLGNRLFEAFLTWLDERVECLTEDQKTARDRVLEGTVVLEEVQEAFDEYMRTQVVVLVDLHAAKGGLKNGMMKKQ